MATKPTYEELLEKNRKLEEEAALHFETSSIVLPRKVTLSMLTKPGVMPWVTAMKKFPGLN